MSPNKQSKGDFCLLVAGCYLHNSLTNLIIARNEKKVTGRS